MVLESNTLDYIFLQDGENGVGIPGKDGKTLYTWVKYSQNADGSNMSDSPENALYIGIAYNKDSATESTNPEDYKWTKIKGEQGLPGTDAYTIILSNESHTFSGNTTSAIPASTKCHVIAYKGTQQLAVTIGMISDLPEGMTAPISNNGTTNAYFSPTVTSSMITKNGTLTIPITVDGKSFTKYFSYSLALQGNNGISATNIILSNESHTFSANASGQADATSINIDIMGYTGSTQVNTQVGEISGLPTGMTMKINNNGTVNTSITVSVTSSLTVAQGVIKIPITANGITIEKSFSYTLSKTGTTGNTGQNATSYKMIVSNAAIVKSQSGTYSPASITLTGKSQTGTSAMANYSGRFKIFLNGSSTASYTSSANESSKTYTIPSNTTSIRCVMYQAGGTSVILDEQTIPVVVDGKDGETGATGTGYTIVLSNESHTFPGSTSAAIASTASTNVIAYKNTSQVAATITKIGNTSVSGNASGVATGITGLTASVANNGTTSCAITFNATTSLTTKSGVVVITMTVDGKTFTKNFSFSLALTGATGTAAKSVDITASSQVFKSTDGGSTFSPDTIKLTPVFQGGISYSKWQYSTNGGSSWTDVSSGSHGLTISSGVLTIAKTSDLYTSSVTSISFKCISNNTSYYDTITVLKLYDVTGLQDDLEDLQNQITTITDTISGVESKVDANTKSITDKIWQSDISTSINEYDGSTVKTIRDRVTSTETDISGIKTTLSDVQTTVSKKADGSTVQTLSTKFATMESNFNGFKTTVSNTYTTKEDFNNLEIGGRNLARKTSNEYCAAFNSFNGNDNICPSLAHVYLKGLSVGDKVTVRLIYKYTNIVAVTGKTAAAWIQGAGNITEWKSGDFTRCPSIALSGSGEKIIKYSFVITSDMIKNQYWNVNIRHDGIQSGSVQWKEFKVEKGNIATDWTPAPEDVEQSITNVSSQYTQLADKFNWIVKSGTSSSDFTITDRMISLTSSALNIDALTTFKNSAENGTSTVINGGAIKSNTITTSKLATDAIKSTNYSYSSGNFSSAGTFLDLSTGLVRSKNFAIDSSGNAYFKGNIQANAGYIGGTSGWSITTNTITGNANSKIISGILESSNYVENSTGIQVNLNTGIIKGNIEASTLAAKEAIKIYVGSTKRNVITGHLASDFFYVRIGCDLSTSNIARVKPSIILNKSTASTNVSDMITINTEVLDIEANTSIVGSLSASGISTYTNGGSWISGKTSAAINILTSQSEGAFHPVLRISSYSGNVWCLGGLGDTVGIYGYYSGRTANGYDWCTTWDTSNGNLTTTNDISCNDIMTRTGWAADRLSHGQTAYSNLMSGRISFKWVQNSSGVWRIYVYVDGALVRDW